MVRELVPIREGAAPRIRQASLSGTPLGVERGRIQVEAKGPACVDYETSFERSWLQPEDSSALVVSQGQWLWRPHPFPAQLTASVEFVLRDGEQVAVPWPREGGRYRLDHSAFFADTYTVFGEFDSKVLEVGGTRLHIARLGAQPSDSQVQRWLERAMLAASSVGPFPRDDVHFVIAPVDVARDDVVFGMLRRGGGASILLVPSVRATRDGLDRDWVAVHELSHLWLPRFHAEDRWLSEGIATYLQEVLRARCGVQTEERAWQRFLDGFARGREAGTGRPLALESRDMDETGAYRRVYWAGAAFALEADLHLRRATGGQRSLLDAIRSAQTSWGTSARPVGADAFLRALDEQEGGHLLELARRYETRSAFPELALRSAELRKWRAAALQPARDGCGLSAESLQ
jgi:hypothetical protein